MKKLLFMFATAALVLSACSSEDDIVQGGGSLSQLGASGALDFDVYTASATKAGEPVGVMNTDKLKTPGKGFGVYATYQDNKLYSELSAAEKVPNFMFNQQVKWTAGWTYSPLKYWPNETTNDSQTEPASSTDCDRLSFFAYAPYVDLTTEGTMTVNRTTPATANAYVEATPSTGILAITRESYQGDPLVEWKANTASLDNQVDLLWGVAPYGMAYQSVNPAIYIDKTFGLPLLDLVKPDKDQKIKFLFQHALSRIGISVVSAIDQIAAGDDGGVYNNAETRVLIKSVEIYGDFGKQGVLNLNNPTENVANWIAESVDKSSVSGAKLFDITAANGNLNADLRYVDAQITAVGTNAANFAKLNTGVLPSETPLFAQGADPSKVATGDALNYAYGKALYTFVDPDYVRATTTATEDVDAYTKDASDNYAQAYTNGAGGVSMNGATRYFKLTEDASVDVTVGNELTDGQTYYTKSGAAGSVAYTKYVANGATDPAGTYYTLGVTELSGKPYTGTCYTSLVPRYFMVIPTGATPVKVKITYAVVTKDESLPGNITNAQNVETKTTSLTLQNGKSYNLKLILGLTSVKLDAVVSDWLVDGSDEVYLPQNND